MATDISDFEDLVAEDVDACPSSVLTSNTKRSIIEFCERSYILNVDFQHDYLDTDIDENNNNALDIDISSYISDVKPTSVMRLILNNIEKYAHEVNILTEVDNYTSIYSDTTIYYHFVDDVTIRLFNITVDSGNVFLKLAVKPLMSATSVADILYEDWAEEIASGAKHRLQMKPNKPYTNIGASKLNETIFKRGIRQAKVKVQRGFSSKEQEIFPQPYGGYPLWLPIYK